MVLQSIFCRRHRKRSLFGGTIAEYVMAVGVGAIVMVFGVTLVVHSGRTFASLYNYADLNSSSLFAIDRVTTDIRNAGGLTFFDPQRIILDGGTNKPLVTLAYSAKDRTLTRQLDKGPETVILTGCDSLDFFIYEPEVASNTLALTSTTIATNAKAVGVTWQCSRSILGRAVNTDKPRTAITVMRRP